MPPSQSILNRLNTDVLTDNLPIVLIIVLGVLFQTIPLFPLAVVGWVVVTCLAFQFPRITIGLTILLGQVAQFELAPLLGIPPEGISVGGIHMRLSDPFVLGIVSTVVLRLLTGDQRLILFLKKGGWVLLAFLLYMIGLLLLNIPSHGIAAAGEFRTYYQFLFLVPYIIVTTRNEMERMHLFLLLILLSLAQILWGGLRGSFLYGWTFSAYEKWLSGFGSLALLYGLYAFASAVREKLFTAGIVRQGFVYGASLALLLVAGARAVWFAGILGFLFIGVSRGIRVRWIAVTLFSALLALTFSYPLFSISGLGPSEFLSERLLAFTDFTSDPTAAWRYSFWGATLTEILKRPWFGAGLGMHFDIYIPEFGELVTTSPHNLYLSILFHGGMVGLILYSFWVVRTGFQLGRSRPGGNADKAIVATSVLVLISVHAYGIAYSFEKDFFTWCYVGLGLSAMLHHPAAGAQLQKQSPAS